MAFSKYRDPPKKRVRTATGERENDPVARAKKRTYEALVKYSNMVETTSPRRRAGVTLDQLLSARAEYERARSDELGAKLKANTPDMFRKKLGRK